MMCIFASKPTTKFRIKFWNFLEYDIKNNARITIKFSKNPKAMNIHIGIEKAKSPIVIGIISIFVTSLKPKINEITPIKIKTV